MYTVRTAEIFQKYWPVNLSLVQEMDCYSVNCVMDE